MKISLPALAALTLLATTSMTRTANAQPAIPDLRDEPGEPPPPPGPREHFILEPGHWDWSFRFHHFVWIHRHWIPSRFNYVHFMPGHWDGGTWIRPHWDH